MSTATATETKPAKVIKPEVEDMAQLIEKGSTYEKGVGTVTPEVYEKILEEGGVEKSMVEKLQKLNTTLVAAATLAHGRASLDLMKKDKTLLQTELSMPMVGKDTLDITFNRTKEVGDGNRENPGKKLIYGQTRPVFSIHASGNRGELAKVKDELAASAATLFS